MTSRAVQYSRYGGPEVLEVVERDDPEPGPGQVRLVVRAASVNPFDAKLLGGLMARDDAPAAPIVPGTDVAGVVEAVGSGVAAWTVGDEVLGRATGGAYAEKAVADADALVAKPDSTSWEVAGSLEVIVHTARAVLDDLAPQPGEVLLVNGASGGIGTIAVQVAAARGARVVGTAGQRHQDAVAALGATPVVYGDGLLDRVRAVTDHVDAVFDVAGKGSLDDLLALAGSTDRVITIAHPDAPARGVRFSGRRWVPGALEDAVAGITAGRLVVPTTTVYPLEQAARAMEDNRTGAVSGKLVLVPWKGPGATESS